MNCNFGYQMTIT